MRSLSLIAVAPLFLLLPACIIVADDDGTTTAADGSAATDGTDGGATDGDGADCGGADVPDDTAGDTADATERCDAFCTDLVEAECESGPTMAGCLLTCESLTSAATCDASASAYFDCVDAATLTCNGLDEPAAPECGLLYLEAIGCAVTESPNPDIVEPCADYCDTIAAAECPNSAALEDCNTNCLWLGNTGTGCDDEWSGYLACFDEAQVSCVLGYAVAEGCGPDFATYSECINASAGG